MTTAIDNGDGTYNVTFSATISGVVTLSPDPNWLMYNSYTLTWEPVQITQQVSATVLKIRSTNLQAGNLKMVILATPAIMTATLAFQLATPILAL